MIIYSRWNDNIYVTENEFHTGCFPIDHQYSEKYHYKYFEYRDIKFNTSTILGCGETFWFTIDSQHHY